MRPSLIYVIEARSGVVKIGRGDDPKRRLYVTATHSPEPVRLIAMWPAVLTEERQLHIRFEQYRSHREWFVPLGPLGQFIADVRGRGVDRIPDWHEFTYLSQEEKRKRGRAICSQLMKAAWSDPEQRERWIQGIRDGRRRSEHRRRPAA